MAAAAREMRIWSTPPGRVSRGRAKRSRSTVVGDLGRVLVRLAEDPDTSSPSARTTRPMHSGLDLDRRAPLGAVRDPYGSGLGRCGVQREEPSARRSRRLTHERAGSLGEPVVQRLALQIRADDHEGYARSRAVHVG
jgi:hypothetical protein